MKRNCRILKTARYEQQDRTVIRRSLDLSFFFVSVTNGFDHYGPHLTVLFFI